MILKETGRYLLNLILKNKSAFLGNEQRDNCYKPCLFLINVVSTFFHFYKSFDILVTSVILHPVGNLRSISGKPICVHQKGNTWIAFGNAYTENLFTWTPNFWREYGRFGSPYVSCTMRKIWQKTVDLQEFSLDDITHIFFIKSSKY